jgi:LAS superfamily LD-carboxypeptidase LdcB
MKRKHFIQLLGYSATALALLPQSVLSQNSNEFTLEMLTGKGNPRLKGSQFQMMDNAFDAFQKMSAEALKSGIKLQVVSGYRDFNRQMQIWNRKYNEFTQQGLSPRAAIDKIVEYSTIPGTSRHHWGTDIDLIDGAVPAPQSVLQEEHFHGLGVFCKMKEWMNENAEKFGFYEVYTDNHHRKGFKYEPWHFSYKPLSIPMLQAYMKLDVRTMIENTNINGRQHLSSQFIEDYINNHILDINPILLP